MPLGPAGSGFTGQTPDPNYFDDPHVSEALFPLGYSQSLSNPGSFASEPAFGVTSTSPSSNTTPSHSLNQAGANNYSNRTTSKATGAFARFGKAIYGYNPPQNPPSNNTSSNSNTSPSQRPPPNTKRQYKQDELQYTARSEIIAMGPSPTENAVAIAGKDCR